MPCMQLDPPTVTMSTRRAAHDAFALLSNQDMPGNVVHMCDMDTSHAAVSSITGAGTPCVGPDLPVSAQVEAAALARIVESLDHNIPARAVPLNEDEALLVRGLQLLTMKPMIYAANVAEADLADQGAGNAYVQALRRKAAEESCEVIIVSAQVRCSGSGLWL